MRTKCACCAAKTKLYQTEVVIKQKIKLAWVCSVCAVWEAPFRVG